MALMKRIWLVLAGVVLLVGVFGLYAFLAHKTPVNSADSSQVTEPLTSFHDPATGASLQYPRSLSNISLSEADKVDKFILRLHETSGEAVLLTVRYEMGVRKASAVAHASTRDLLLDSTKRAFPLRFPGYKQVSQRKFDLNGQPAAEVIFTYESPAHEAVEQRFVIVVKDDEDTAVYLAAQASGAAFDTLNRRYFTPVVDSLSFK